MATKFERLKKKSYSIIFLKFKLCEYVNISQEDRGIFLQARKTFLFHNNNPWNKKQDSDFDVGMGSFDGAECCELTGLYILSCLKHLNVNLGLYRDDALGVADMTPRQMDMMKKEICKIFKQMKLSITIEVNIKVVNFLDITLDLNSGVHKPYMKSNDSPIYINQKSNHPPSILKKYPCSSKQKVEQYICK